MIAVLLFERGAFRQERVDQLIEDGYVPVYRDPQHPTTHATVRNPGVKGRCSVWAHPTMPLHEIDMIDSVSLWNP